MQDTVGTCTLCDFEQPCNNIMFGCVLITESVGELQEPNHQPDHFSQHQLNYHHPPEKLHGAQSLLLHPSSSRFGFDSKDISLSDLSGSFEDEDDEEDEDDDDDLLDSDSGEINPLLEVGNRKRQSQKRREQLNKDSIHHDHDHQQILNDGEDDDGHCFHNGQIYKTGGSWTVQSECSQCFCERGLVSCKPIACDVPAECKLARVQPLSCCPVCDGEFELPTQITGK